MSSNEWRSAGWRANHSSLEAAKIAHPSTVPHIRAMTADPHAALRDRVLQSVLDGRGESEPSIRHAAAAGVGVSAELEALVDKIHTRAYAITDDDVARARATYGDDRMFEVIVSAALGASRERLLAGLRALDDA
jgi:hypothetical protein